MESLVEKLCNRFSGVTGMQSLISLNSICILFIEDDILLIMSSFVYYCYCVPEIWLKTGQKVMIRKFC